ncbi:hypothetical protein [Psychromonas antarctica]|uniref:hypothetical protein n=1 Tax=Psychromonas antarctica TaxID=67573 RepID=UPI001EE959EA|nr:hypothetical protein [Psychromonas antarctica]MCG6201813.1 hypothetical protein [Psychromonas antarctica]
MEFIYKIIQEDPSYFAWAFGLVNILWVGFAYFNKQRHEKEMVELSNSLKFESDRKLKIFELKVRKFEKYVTTLDSFGKKHQVDLPQKMQPIIDKYLSEYLNATAVGDKEEETNAITWFSSEIGGLMSLASEDYSIIQAESSKLKLTATDEMVEAFDKMELLIKNGLDESTEFMGGFVQMVLSQNFEPAEKFQENAKISGEKIKESSKALLNLMRAELNQTTA